MEKHNSSNQKQEPTDFKPITKDASTDPIIFPRNIDFIPIIDQPLFAPQYQPSFYRPSRKFVVQQIPSVPAYLKFNYIRK